ncbi:GNAT family N-acetyltransferase [Frigidibacter sp. MR17.14]|uniref:GNAT family N-acetyltransferase n=1 Tax=Frigidibacter sp. MR17.14 TaxID=3126509 RepID=UPI003012EE29
MRLVTDRLILRPFEDRDRTPWAAMNADPEVRRFFPALMTRAEADAQIDRFEAARARDGIAFAAAERREDGAFLGMVGLNVLRLGTPLDGAVEIGWRLARAHWGQGYATEGAQAWRDHGFTALRLPEIVAIVARGNLPSQAVMLRLEMAHDPARDFAHPALPEGHPLAPHLTFAIRRPD